MNDSPQAQPPTAPERIYIIPDLHKPGSFYREWVTDASPQRQGIKYVREDLPRSAADDDTGVSIIAAERQRQVQEEGWTPDHDDEHDDQELAQAAAAYAMGKAG